MKRENCIELLIDDRISSMSSTEKEEQLEVMCLEDWSEAQGWDELSQEVSDQFEEGELLNGADHESYLPVLKLWLRDDFAPVSNVYLINELKKIGTHVKELIGKEVKYECCPCCGYRTLEERSCYSICRVCWWEDDGQDNGTANVQYGGPNYGISLAEARYNFLKTGIYDPKREDLMEKRDPPDMYVQGREFYIENEVVKEKGTGWISEEIVNT